MPSFQPLYPSDTTDAEWTLIEPLLPVPACLTPAGGRPEKHSRRAIIDAIRYVTDNGGKWRALPVDFPPWQTVHGFFTRWTNAGVVEHVRDQLREQVRVRAGRTPTPSAAAIDSQTVRAPPKPSAKPAAATTPARRSTAVNATSPWTPWVCCW
jgi:transposase